MTELPAYAAGLMAMLALCGFTIRRHPGERWQIIRCAGAILFNWIAGVIYVRQTGDYTPWAFSIFIDALAALAVMFHPAGRVQGYIGLFYLLQIACHTGFGLREWLSYRTDSILYYDAITWIAWAQLAAMGGWCSAIWGDDILHRMRDRRHAADSRARRAHIRKSP